MAHIVVTYWTCVKNVNNDVKTADQQLQVYNHAYIAIPALCLAGNFMRPRRKMNTIVMSMSVCVTVSVCLSVCLSVCRRWYLRNHTRNLYQFLPMSVARSSSGMLTIGRIAHRREGDDGSAQRGRSVIYDCHFWLQSHRSCDANVNTKSYEVARCCTVIAVAVASNCERRISVDRVHRRFVMTSLFFVAM